MTEDTPRLSSALLRLAAQASPVFVANVAHEEHSQVYYGDGDLLAPAYGNLALDITSKDAANLISALFNHTPAIVAAAELLYDALEATHKRGETYPLEVAQAGAHLRHILDDAKTAD
jgi:hypothetical protein